MAKFKVRSKFEAWAYKYAGGANGLSRSLGVHRSTVGHWFTRNATPSLELTQKIIKLSGGKLTLTDILNGTKAP